MDVLGDVVARERRSPEPALRAAETGRRYDYRRFCTSAWKVGNFLRHLGVREGVTVAVADDPVPETVLTFYGAALLGAAVRFGPPTHVDGEVQALVVPVSELDDHETGPSTRRVVYGDAPDDPSVSYFERDVWSENPTEPPDLVDPALRLLESGTSTHSHRDVLRAARAAVDTWSIGPEATVAVAGPFTDAEVVAAGLVAPVLAGATLEVGPGATGDVVVGGPDSSLPSGSLFDR